MGSTIGHIFTKVWVQLLQENGVVTMVTTPHGPVLTGASFASTSKV
jgi:hypothetical protein